MLGGARRHGLLPVALRSYGKDQAVTTPSKIVGDLVGKLLSEGNADFLRQALVTFLSAYGCGN